MLACALTEPRSSPNLTLNLQTLLEFHVEECNFDFNKWIYAGIPYTGTMWGMTKQGEGEEDSGEHTLNRGDGRAEGQLGERGV